MRCKGEWSTSRVGFQAPEAPCIQCEHPEPQHHWVGHRSGYSLAARLAKRTYMTRLNSRQQERRKRTQVSFDNPMNGLVVYAAVIKLVSTLCWVVSQRPHLASSTCSWYFWVLWDSCVSHQYSISIFSIGRSCGLQALLSVLVSFVIPWLILNPGNVRKQDCPCTTLNTTQVLPMARLLFCHTYGIDAWWSSFRAEAD